MVPGHVLARVIGKEPVHLRAQVDVQVKRGVGDRHQKVVVIAAFDHHFLKRLAADGLGRGDGIIGRLDRQQVGGMGDVGRPVADRVGRPRDRVADLVGSSPSP